MGRKRSEGEAERPVLPWRLVVGVLLHFVVPAYLLTLLAAWLSLGAPTHEAAHGELEAIVVEVSWRFLVGYALLILIAALFAAALNPVLTRRRARRKVDDPKLAAHRSAARMAEACIRAGRLASGATGEPIAAVAARLRRGAWDHADERDQKLSADLAEAVDAFARAHASAKAEGKQEVATFAAASLTRIAIALDELAEERRQLDRGDALTHARYLDARYGSALDSTGSSSG